jgi:pyrroloquinoline quinone biosynthesis protein D
MPCTYTTCWESGNVSEPVSLQPDDVLAIGRYYRLQWEEAQQAYVLLYPEGMVELSETAAAVLTRCNGQASLAHIIADLQQQFPDDDIAADVREFLEDAYAHGWVRLTRAG